MSVSIRKIVVSIEDLCIEAGQPLECAVRKVVAAAVITNPLAGRHVENLDVLIATGEMVGQLLAVRAVEALGADRPAVSYGKAAIVGVRGELEHAAALLHPKMGKPIRAAIGQGLALIPSVTKRGGPGTTVDIPLQFKDDEWSFDHFDAASLEIADAPGDDEIVVVLALADRGRPLARVHKV